jgi:hypothetical protein
VLDSRPGQNIFVLQNVQTVSGAHPVSNRYRELFARRQSGRGVNLTTHLHLVSRLRMSGGIPLLPLYVRLHGLDRDNLTFTRSRVRCVYYCRSIFELKLNGNFSMNLYYTVTLFYLATAVCHFPSSLLHRAGGRSAEWVNSHIRNELSGRGNRELPHKIMIIYSLVRGF